MHNYFSKEGRRVTKEYLSKIDSESKCLERKNERVTIETRKTYIVACVIICACLVYLKWGA